MTYSAPARRYAFNESLTTSDGLLIMSIARAMSIDYNAAKRVVSDAVMQIKDRLTLTGEFTMGRIGRLEKSMVGDLQFVPASTDRLSPTAGWMESLDVKDFVLSTNSVSRSKQKHSGRNGATGVSIPRFLRISIAAAAAVFIGLVVSTPVTVRDTYMASTVPNITAPRAIQAPIFKNPDTAIVAPMATQSASIVPDTVATPKVEEVLLTEQTQTAPVQQERKHHRRHRHDNVDTASVPQATSVLPTPTQQPVAKTLPAKPNTIPTGACESEPEETLRFEFSDPFVLVVASLPNIDDALRFVRETKAKTGIKLGIIHTDNRYRVYAATGQTRREAQMQASQLSRKFPGAWATGRYDMN